MQRILYHIFDWGGPEYDGQPIAADISLTRHPVAEGDPNGNAWSSQTRENPDWHMPVIDVDVMLDGRAKAIIEGLFPDARYVRSTHNYHVYSDTPITWELFLQRLDRLVDDHIVEAGYVRAARARKATFVRLPGVPKQSTLPEAPDERRFRILSRYQRDLKIEHSDIMWLLACARRQEPF